MTRKNVLDTPPALARLPRLRTVFLGVGLAIVSLLLLSSKPVVVAFADGGSRDSSDSSDRHDVEDLVTCYSLGTDAIGRAVNAVGAQPLDSTVNVKEPNFAEGLAYYRNCFSR